MYKILVILFIAIAYANSSDVIEMTDADFSLRIQDHPYVLVMFYAPWCGHCKKFKPEFEKAASVLKTSDHPVHFAKVDCTESGKETCNKYGVQGYPTIKIFNNGEFLKEYQGPREANGVIKYMKSQVGPSAKDLSTKEVFDKFLEDPDVAVVGFFKSDSKLSNAFSKVADTLREKVRFGVTKNDELLSSNKLEDGVILFRPKHLHNKFEPSNLKYDGDAKSSSLESWLNKNMLSLVDHRHRDNFDLFKFPLITAYYNVDYIKDPKGTNYWRNRIFKVAQNYADDYTFAISSKADFQHELNEFGYDYIPSEKPVVFARTADNKKYVMKDEFSVENFEAFVSDLKNGELESYLKSEAIPENNDTPVKTAVAKNFDELIVNNNKDVFIEFYAPWCGHCKKLTPIWDSLGEKLANEDVVIAKMDATSNDVPSQFDVKGFPTIYWAPKDGKSSPVAYNGGRTIDELLEYVAKHSTNELRDYDRSGNPKTKEEL